MALSLDDAETDRLARQVATLTGESLIAAVRKALAERLERERRRRRDDAGLERELETPARDCVALPDYDTRSADEFIGYDDVGAPR